MQKLAITITLAVIALALGTTTTTTTMQIQPAYSQATHCREVFGISTCVTPGRDPLLTEGDDQEPLTHQEAGRQIGGCHSTAAQISGLVECTVTHP